MTLLLGAVAALACFTLGLLELLWPAGVRRGARPRPASGDRQSPRRASVTSAAAVRVSAERLVTLVERARAETDSARRTAALRVAILTLERWRASSAAPDDAVGRALERARTELWTDYQRMAFRRLGSTTPWRATALQ